MAYQAGKYSDSFTWMKQSTTTDSFGQRVEIFTDNGILWGSITPTIGTEAEAYGATQAQTDATIRFRQYPTISAKDRLIHKRFNETYIITGIYRTNNETLCDVTKYEELILVNNSVGSFNNDFDDSFDI